MATGVQPEPSDGAQAHRHRRARDVKRFLRDVVVIVLAAIVISVGIKTFLLRSFYIPSESMEDTLQIDDRIVVNELVPNLIPIKRGDVVVFRDPGGWLGPRPQVDQNWLVASADWALSVVGPSASDSDDHLVEAGHRAAGRHRRVLQPVRPDVGQRRPPR